LTCQAVVINFPVVPEIPYLLKSLTFSSLMRILDGRASASPEPR